jgi:uncharacterized protein (TIGR02001 family)
MTKLSQAIALATAMTAGLAATATTQAEVEVSASAAVANMYLWRGQDLGAVTNAGKSTGGVPAVSGGIQADVAGAYAGAWTSSGDANLGQEYDIYAGYGGEAGALSYDVSIWTYVYPDGGATNGTFGDNSEVIISLGAAGAAVGIYKQVGDVEDNDNMYYTLGYGMGSFSGNVGIADAGAKGKDYAHLDLSYAYNDNISFTVSKIVDQEVKKTLDEDTKFVVSYSLPIEL